MSLCVYRHTPPGGNQVFFFTSIQTSILLLSLFYIQQCPGQAIYHLKMTSGSKNSLTYKENELKD